MSATAIKQIHAEARPEPETFRVIIHRRTVTRILLATVGLLTLLSLAGQVSRFYLGMPYLLGFVPLFYVDMEGNVPTWYETMALAFASLLAGLLALSALRARAPFARHWLAIALLLLFMSVDEAARLHEATMNPLQRVIGPVEGAWQPIWVVVGIAAACIVAALFLRFFLHLPRRDQVQVFAAAALFVTGAVVVEMVSSSLFHELYSLTWTASFPYALFAHLEELLEMLGVVVFIDFLLRRLAGTGPFSFAVRG